MLGVRVPRGAIFHACSKRRRPVVFDHLLRERTEASVRRLHELFALGQTPPPLLKPRCRGCSLHDICMPEVFIRPDRINGIGRTMYTPISASQDSD
jgi:CRISPR-associated exonuclease Cas4